MGKINVTLHYVNSNKLPVIIKATDKKHAGLGPLLQFLNEDNALFKEQLLKHGAVLLRGFQINSPDDFSAVIDACSLGTVFNYDLCTIPRTKIQKGIYTSINYTEASIPMHNEKAYDYDTPSHIYFNCAQPSVTGGCTPLIDGNKLWFSLPHSLKDKLENKGIMYRRYYFGTGIKLKLATKICGDLHHNTWMETFNTQDQSEVEDKLANTIYQYEWKGTDLITKKIMPAYRTHPQSGKLVWFNQCHNLNRYSHISISARKRIKNPLARYLMSRNQMLPIMALFGDAQHFSQSEINLIHTAMDKNKVMTPWQKGDVMIVDNYACLHGKTAHTGDRLILVGMTQQSSEILT